jgi:phosphoglycerol transferase MdoB-like AlkP superfamily enzyme
MKTFSRFVPAHLRFLIAVHLILLGIYSGFRYVTLLYNRPTWLFNFDHTVSVSEAFWVGLRFDITVSSYALFLPYMAMCTAMLFKFDTIRLYRTVRIYCGAAILVSLLICAADVPFFNFYNSRLNTAAVNWKNNSIVIKFLLTNIKYYPFILILLVGIWGIGRVMNNVWKRTWSHAEHSYHNRLTATGLATMLLLCGLWGGATPKTPDMKEAYFSNDGFINQLSLNPVQTWFDSYSDFEINVFKTKEAIAWVQQELGIKKPKYDSPIARKHVFGKQNKPKNVVLVLMESMTADRMGIFGNQKNLTPGLDSLARNSLFFNNCYSNGIHTNAGIYSTLYGMPIVMMQHPMYNSLAEDCQFTGLPVTLQKLGYTTTFFCTHPKTFDNLEVFLPKNGYDHISDLADYPPDQIANSWGVGDESLFGHAFNVLDSLADDPSGKPFFATLLSITAHPPFTLPAFTKFKPRSTDPIEITYEYADWSIKNFMDNCAKEPWYENTVFVFVGDHGVNIPGAYAFDVPLSYNHVPLIIHAPGIYKNGVQNEGLANQTDIFPTVMHLLGQNYVQNTLGFDLLEESRPFAFFSQDFKMGVLNDRYLYVVRKSGTDALYDYRSGSGENISAQFPALTDSMHQYACANLQVAQWMILNKKTGLKE